MNLTFWDKPYRPILIFFIFLLMTSCSSTKKDFKESIAEAFHMVDVGDYEGAQLKALEAEQLLNDDSPLEDREVLSRIFGSIYYHQNSRDKAKEHISRALTYATEMQDTSLILINQFNLGLCAATTNEAISNFEHVCSLAQKAGNNLRHACAAEKLAQVYISTNDFTKAQQLLDSSVALSENNRTQLEEIAITQCRLWLAEGKYDDALEGYKTLCTDSLNVYGRLIRVNAIYDILLQKEDYRNALLYKDSVYLYTDSINRLDGRKQVEEIEKNYRSDIDRKNQNFRIFIVLFIVAILTILVILLFIAKNLRLRKRQVELADRISVLNARIAELHPKEEQLKDSDKTAFDDMLPVTQLIQQKFELSLEVFKSLEQYGVMKKLNLLRDFNSGNKAELKEVYDVIVGRFSDCCSDIRQTFSTMTNDDCIFCTMTFIGCSKEVISASMGASEEALRRRKSRIKQKLPESTFLFFFSR